MERTIPDPSDLNVTLQYKTEGSGTICMPSTDPYSWAQSCYVFYDCESGYCVGYPPICHRCIYTIYVTNYWYTLSDLNGYVYHLSSCGAQCSVYVSGYDCGGMC